MFEEFVAHSGDNRSPICPIETSKVGRVEQVSARAYLFWHDLGRVNYKQWILFAKYCE